MRRWEDAMDTKFQKKHESDMTKREKLELEREKLASMNGKEKKEYILSYYKLHIAAAIGVILLIIGAGMWLYHLQNETMLYAAVINERGMDSSLMEEFRAFREDGEKHHKYVLDTSIAVSSQEDSGAEDYASRMKIRTLVGSNIADVYLCPESLYQEYAKEEGFLVPMSELLDEGFRSDYAGNLRKDAVWVAESEMLKRYGYQGNGSAYLIVFSYSEHKDIAADFIRFLLAGER